MKQNNTAICAMDEIHVTKVAALEARCFADPWNEDSIRGELTNPLSLWLVALDGDEVVGYIGSQSVLGEADVMNIAVDANYRKQGIGHQLISSLQRYLTDNQVHSLTLEVRPSNDPALRLYETCGFVQIGRRPGYYRNPKEDALILRKEWSL